ncbi:50S ribosomal protein L22 [Candidatus Altiarchaeota archaeon]
MKIKYAIQPEDPENTVKAIGRDINVSFKDMVMVAKSLRGMMLPKAIDFMDKVIEKKAAVEYTRFKTNIGHRKGDVKIGKYPEKAAKNALATLRNIEANAEFKGFDTSLVKLFHVEALHGVSRVKKKPKGRYATWKTEYVHLQVIGRQI